MGEHESSSEEHASSSHALLKEETHFSGEPDVGDATASTSPIMDDLENEETKSEYIYDKFSLRQVFRLLASLLTFVNFSHPHAPPLQANALCDAIIQDRERNSNSNVSRRIDWKHVSEVAGLDAINAKILWKYLAYGEMWKIENISQPEVFLDAESDEVHLIVFYKISMNTCKYICTYVRRTYAATFVHMYARTGGYGIHTRIYACPMHICVDMCAPITVPVCAFIRMYACARVCMSVCGCCSAYISAWVCLCACSIRVYACLPMSVSMPMNAYIPCTV